MILLALPGSTYVYQGEELGLQEVPDLPRETLQDPMATWSQEEKGRDGCRVPLPWTATGPSLGFGPGPAMPPQPDWFARYAVSTQTDDPTSTLSLYRRALRLRRELAVDESFDWVPAESADVLSFRRGSWWCVTNFGTDPVPLPAGELLLASTDLDGTGLPGDTTVWLRLE